METRNHDVGGGEIVTEHKHENYDYWHPATRVHAESTRDELPIGHILSQKSLAEKLVLDRVEVTPIQMMGIGASLEIGAVQSLMEGLEHHRAVGFSTPIIRGKLADNGEAYNEEQYALFYAEWCPNYSNKPHRYLIEVRRGEDVYVGYFPYDGRKPRLYGIYHKKQDVIKFLHKTHSSSLQIPELTLLTELNIPNITFGMRTKTSSTTPSDLEKYGADHVGIYHKQGYFYTRSFYGDFVPLEKRTIENVEREPFASNLKVNGNEIDIPWTLSKDSVSGRAWLCEDSKTLYLIDSTGYNMNDPKHPYYMFQGATGYIQLFEGKMFCYPDGSIRFLPKDAVFANEVDFAKHYTEQPPTIIFTGYTDLQIVQGDLVAYELEGHTVPEPQPIGKTEYDIDRHKVMVGWHDEPVPDTEEEEKWHDVNPNLLKYDNLGGLYVREDCILTITHPEHGETKYEAFKGEMLALLPGTSRPFQKDEGRD